MIGFSNGNSVFLVVAKVAKKTAQYTNKQKAHMHLYWTGRTNMTCSNILNFNMFVKFIF